MGRRLARTGLAFAATAGLVVFALWPRDDVPREPDAVVVLGGSGIDRAQLGMTLRDRYDAILVLSSSAMFFGRHLGARCGVDALCVIPETDSTAGEARTVARLVEEHGWDHVTVTTGRHHTTRSRVLFRQCLGNRVTVVGSERPARSWVRAVYRFVYEGVGTAAALTVWRAC